MVRKEEKKRANELTRVLESIRAGTRLPEARFSNLKIAHQGQSSVYSLAKKPA